MLEILIAFIVICVFILLKKSGNYWKERQISYIKPLPVIGNFGAFLCGRIALAELIQEFYYSHPEQRYVGIYSFFKPVLLLTDIDLIKQITIKDFEHFTDRRTFVSEDTDPLFAKGLFALTGQRWKNMRSTLSPAFTSGKMKTMFNLIKEIADQFTNHLTQKTDANIILTVELKDLFTRFANDVIATSAFGIKCDSLKDRNNEFFSMAQKTSFDGFINNLKLFGYDLSPKLMKLFSVTLFDNKVYNFFRDIIVSTVKIREDNNIVRPDMIHLLMEARNGKLNENNDSKQKIELSADDMAAQALFFFFAGFETISILLSHMSTELAQNKAIQNKLQKEIDEVIEEHGYNVPYETLMEMKYMDMVINETLRKWPPVPIIDRYTVKPYTIEASKADENILTLEKENDIWIPIYAIQRDPKYFPNPETFDPERFNKENKNSIKPFSFMPFGIGPRNCIGARFALLEAKILIFYLLSKFDLMVVKKSQIPLKLKRLQFNLHAEKGFWIGLKRR